MNNRYAQTDPGNAADEDTSDPSWRPPASLATDMAAPAKAAPASPSRQPSARAAAAAATRRLADCAPKTTAEENLIDTAVDYLLVQAQSAKRKRASDALTELKRVKAELKERKAELKELDDAIELKRVQAELKERKAELAELDDAIAAKSDAGGLPQCPICLKSGNHTLMTVKQAVLPGTGLVAMVPTSPAHFCDTCAAGLNSSCPIRREPISWVRTEFRPQDLIGSSRRDAMLVE